MSLNTSLSIATSGLKTTQRQLTTVSNNVANADVAGYTRKVASTESRVVGGEGGGVKAATASSSVNRTLLRQRDESASTVGAAEVSASYLDSLQASLGTTDGNGSLTDAVDGLATSLEALAVTPEGRSASATVVDEAQRLAMRINGLSVDIQTLRSQADSEIGDVVDEANSTLHHIEGLNRQIIENEAQGRSTADLEDQRARSLESLSRNMDVTYFTNSKNQVQVYTASGTPLLDGLVHELEFDPASGMDRGLVYDPSSVGGLSGISVDGKDVTSELHSGRLGALLDLRDGSLVSSQAEVDELSETLAGAVNAAHNQGVSVPPPESLTGTLQVAGTDAFTGTGMARIALLDAEGTVQEAADLDLSSYATYGDLVAALDGVTGVSASIDAAGRVTLVADDPAMGVALNEMDSAAGPEAGGLSQHLGLNSFYVRDASGRLSVRSDIVENPERLATGTLSQKATLAAGDVGVGSGDSSTVARMTAALGGEQSFDAAGRLGATSDTVSGYAAEITGLFAREAQEAESDAQLTQLVYNDFSASIAERAGVNLDEETAELSILENNYSAMANVIKVIEEMYDALLAMV